MKLSSETMNKNIASGLLAATIVCLGGSLGAESLPMPVLSCDFDDPGGLLFIGEHHARTLGIASAFLRAGHQGKALFFHPDSANHLPAWMAKPENSAESAGITTHQAVVALAQETFFKPNASWRIDLGAAAANCAFPFADFPGGQKMAVFSFFAKGGGENCAVMVGIHGTDDAVKVQREMTFAPEWRRYALTVDLDEKAKTNKLRISFAAVGRSGATFNVDCLQLEPGKNHSQFQTCPTEWMPGGTSRKNVFPSLPLWKIPAPIPGRTGTASLWVCMDNDFPELDTGDLTWLTLGDAWRRGMEISGNGVIIGSHYCRVNIKGYLTDGKKHHLATVWDEHEISIYVDAKKVGGKRIDHAYAMSEADYRVNFTMSLGTHSPRRRTPHGWMDDLAIFSQPLTVAQIQTLAAPDTRVVDRTAARIVLPDELEWERGPRPFSLQLGFFCPDEPTGIAIAGQPGATWEWTKPGNLQVVLRSEGLALGQNEFRVSFDSRGRRYDIPLSFLAYAPPIQPQDWRMPPVGEHPRLLFTKEDLPGLRQRLNTARGRQLFKHLLQATPPAQYFTGLDVKKYFDDLMKLDSEETDPTERQAIKDWLDKDQAKGALSVQGQGLSWMTKSAFLFAVMQDEEAGQQARRSLMLQIKHGHPVPAALQPAAMIYDWCWPLFDANEKKAIREWLAGIADEAIKAPLTEFWGLTPSAYELPGYYWATLAASKAGMAALAMEGEGNYKAEWLDVARQCIDLTVRGIFEPGGSFGHGLNYWHSCFSEVCWFWEAMRLRGMGWEKNEKVRGIPAWITSLIRPGSMEGNPGTLTVGRCPELKSPLPLMWFAHVYPDNPLAAWNYRAATGTAMYDSAPHSPVPWILWDQNPSAFVDPATVLPRTKPFRNWGIFFRGGWQADDHVFWMGAHENRSNRQGHFDYGSFYIHAFGRSFTRDLGLKHSFGALHNLVDIDGQAPGGKDWRAFPSLAPLSSILDGKVASGAVVEQKEMYDWEYLAHPERQTAVIHRQPLNPVRWARRAALAVWPMEGIPAYLVVADDIDKDGSEHQYGWNMMLPEQAEVDCSQGFAQLHWPDDEGLSMDVAFLDSAESLPEVKAFTHWKIPMEKLTVGRKAVNPGFAVMLYPKKKGMPVPAMTRARSPGGFSAVKLSWPDDVVELLAFNRPDVEQSPEPPLLDVSSDARIAFVRLRRNQPIAAIMIDGTYVDFQGKRLIESRQQRGSHEWMAN